ncbi:MAG: AbrB/MazE/SpoVT family DNA-binding domain-containing protein [Peptococcaceae bacterium]|nr:AbrB/MazE/SpoVT family DNA-binding domain-containing protein [Peptococcaceae bacterium]
MATVSSKGRIIIPAEVRKKKGIKQGDRFEVKMLENQLLLVYVEKKSLAGLYGLFKGEGLTRALREEHERELAKEKGGVRASCRVWFPSWGP